MTISSCGPIWNFVLDSICPNKGVHTLEEELDIINDDIREKLSVFIGQEEDIKKVAKGKR